MLFQTVTKKRVNANTNTNITSATMYVFKDQTFETETTFFKLSMTICGEPINISSGIPTDRDKLKKKSFFL